MNPKIKLLLATFTIASCTQTLTEALDTEVLSGSDDASIEVTRTKKCLKARNLKICNKATIAGALTAGSITLSPTPSIGTVGVPGLGGDLAYGAVGNTGAQTIANGAPISFNLLTTVPGSGVLQTSSGLTVSNAGIYKIQAIIAGQATAAGQTFVFYLENNGAPVPNAANASNTSASAGVLIVNGFGIISLPANSSLSLVNVSGFPVTLFSSGTAANAILTAERIA